MSRHVSPSTHRPYGVAMVSRLWRVARATIYRHRSPAVEPRRPGPVGPMPDDELVVAIRDLLAQGPFHGEGYRKIWARLRFTGIRTSKRRVLRLTREHGLQAPGRVGRPHGPKAHDGTIRTARVDAMWGTDLTSALTGEGQASIFVTVDHCSTECLGIHAARRGRRSATTSLVVAGSQAPGSRPSSRSGRVFAPASVPSLEASQLASSFATITAASTSPTTSSANSPSSASRARPPSCASPKATAAPSASSGR